MTIKAIIFDFNGTLFHSISQLAPGAENLFAFCKEHSIRMAAITAGVYEETVIHHLGLDEAMEKIQVVQDGGKTPMAFQQLLDEMGVAPEQAIAIGDMKGKEIRCMNMIGGKTIWIHGGHLGSPSVNPDENPTYSVENLKEAQEVLEQLIAQE